MKLYDLIRLSVIGLTMIICSCDNESIVEQDEQKESTRGSYECDLIMDISMEDYDAKSTRASLYEWLDGDIIYLAFNNSGNKVEGRAIYKESEGLWKLNYYAPLSNTVSASCTAVYLDGYSNTTDDSNVSINATTAIYEDTNATFTKSGSTVTVKVSLKPKSGRMRFKGVPNSKFNVKGIKYNVNYKLTTGTFTISINDVEVTVGADGYTPYLYGVWNSTSRKLLLTFGEVSYYTECESAVLAAGKSGYMNIPTDENRNGWLKRVNPSITISNISYKMVFVEGGTYTMGATAEQVGYGSDERPTHSVTLHDFYIGQTEVTQGLWQAVMGYTPTNGGNSWSSSNGLGSNYPAYYVSWDDCKQFISKLNQLTSKQFRLPTEAEWEYAARGGMSSLGYLYSGSNNIGDVAWYTSNSGNTTHPVATKAPNELGLYDMSGNVWEWCEDLYGTYSSSVQTNPTGPTSGSYRVSRGGSWYYFAPGCRVAYRYANTPSNLNGLGLRLVLVP